MHPRDRAQLSSTRFKVVVEANMAREDRKIEEFLGSLTSLLSLS